MGPNDHSANTEKGFALENPVPEGFVVIASSQDYKEVNELGLVILAMGKAYWTFEAQGTYLMCVRDVDVLAVGKELKEYTLLGRHQHVLKTGLQVALYPVTKQSFWLYALLLTGAFAAQNHYGLTDFGRADSIGMVRGHEWWRALTALFLHADGVHLLSNVVSGVGFAFLTCRSYGTVLAWALIVLSGTLGNALNALVYYPEAHYSIGASTAVFAALGLLTASGIWQSIRMHGDFKAHLPKWILPLCGGLTLFGLLGLGGENTDVAAHISGFIVGGLIGLGVYPWILSKQSTSF